MMTADTRTAIGKSEKKVVEGTSEKISGWRSCCDWLGESITAHSTGAYIVNGALEITVQI